MAKVGVLELSPAAGGRWLVETESGSRHLFDLDARMYSRRGRRNERKNGLMADVRYGVVEIERWPRINSTFEIWIDAGDGDELNLVSTYVTRIVSIAADEDMDSALPSQTILEEVAQAPPSNAWILIGDEASFPSEEEFRAQRDLLNPELPYWTCPRQIQRGDLVFVYFIAPRKAIHFVTRSLLPPVFDPTVHLNAIKDVDPNQWWTELAPLVPVPPVPYSELLELHGGHLVLRGKPTHYLTPTVVNRLVAQLGKLDDDQRLVLKTPVGDPDLPDAARMTLDDLRRIASGRLRLEAEVEHYIVEPLLRMCFAVSEGFSIERQTKIGAGRADFGVYREQDLIGVVEAKIGVQRRRNGGLLGSPDLAQVVRYATAANVPALLIDCNQVFLIENGSEEPSHTLDRQRLTNGDLRLISDHVLVPQA